tara:strand:- start:33727 stop:34779 length:1053 start_codon:yes stop_codon:yes gene_type:complete
LKDKSRQIYWWCKENLFATYFQGLLSILGIYLIAWLVWQFLIWGIFDATFVGKDISSCERPGACWAMVTARWEQFIYGFYPEGSRWRVNLSCILFFVTFLIIAFSKISTKLKFVVLIVNLFVITSLLMGGYWGLDVVKTEEWGGLFLTLVLAFGGIIAAFPIALLLALGRQSELKIIKTLCVVFIETVRGVPLISVLFMASFMLPLFLPEGINFDKLLRAMVGITLFQAAYLAEVIRGGLNALSKGQFEASVAIGLNYWQMMRLIILPQALRLMIPGIVNTFIALFKDTTLVLIIGLFDFLGIVQSAITDPKWIGSALEAYVFCAIVYWVFCYSMSAYSQHLEKKLKVSR